MNNNSFRQGINGSPKIIEKRFSLVKKFALSSVYQYHYSYSLPGHGFTTALYSAEALSVSMYSFACIPRSSAQPRHAGQSCIPKKYIIGSPSGPSFESGLVLGHCLEGSRAGDRRRRTLRRIHISPLMTGSPSRCRIMPLFSTWPKCFCLQCRPMEQGHSRCQSVNLHMALLKTFLWY